MSNELLSKLSDHDAAATIAFGVHKSAREAFQEDGDVRFLDPDAIAHATAELLMRNGFHR